MPALAPSCDPSRPAVLVVEDDALVRAEALDLCEEAGFIACEARDADAALRILERRSDIRVLFTDVEMPGSMDGLQLAHAVRERWPAVVIILTSGRVAVGKLEMPENARFFAKPYPPDGIVEALSEIAEPCR